MNYRNPQLRDRLAAEYLSGTQTGRVRRRFAQRMKYDVDLRRVVSQWETRLAPLAAPVPEVSPPERVWRAIAARLNTQRVTAGQATRLGWWRGLAALSTAFAVVLASLLVLRPPADDGVSTVAVLADSKSQPSMVVSWPAGKTASPRRLKIRMLAAPALPLGKSFELWMLPGGTAAPVSLGVLSADPAQTVTVSDAAAKMLPHIAAMAVSVEPAGGSTTGLPTGPVILSGPFVKII